MRNVLAVSRVHRLNYLNHPFRTTWLRLPYTLILFLQPGLDYQEYIPASIRTYKDLFFIAVAHSRSFSNRGTSRHSVTGRTSKGVVLLKSHQHDPVRVVIL